MKKLIYTLPIFIIPLVTIYLLSHKDGDKYYTVEERPVKKLVYASGVVRPSDYVIVRSEVSGYVKEIFVKENQLVTKGQKLALIDPGPLVYRMQEIQARLNLVEDRLNPNSDYVKSLQEDIRKLEIKLQQDKLNLERRENLFQKGLIPKEQYENAKTNYEITQKEYEKAWAIYRDSLVSLRRERQILQAQLNQIKSELDRYYITSPINGFVLKKYVNIGDYISAVSQDNRVFSIGGKGEWEVILDVDEEFLGLIKEDMIAYVTLDAYPTETFQGKVKEIIRDVDKGRRVFQVKLSIDLPERTPANATAEANIVVYEKRALVIPKDAVKEGKVIKFDGVRLREVDVRLGQEIDNYVEVLEGLKVGDKIKLR